MDNLVGAVGHAALVRDDDDRHARLVELAEQVHHLDGGLAVQCTRRLVGQDDVGLRNDGAGYRYTLFLPARQFAGQVVRPFFQAEPFELLHGQGVAPAAAHALVVERQGHVLDGVLERDEVEGLKDEANHAVAVVGGAVLAEVADGGAVQDIFAAVIGVEDAEDVEQGRLPRARGTHDRDELAPFDVERDAFQHVQRGTGVIRLLYVFQVDE